MPGGLLQLVAYGIQDFILSGNPEITFFKKAYRRNTLFSSETLELKFSGNQDFGKKVECNIPNNGDLLGKTTLQIDIPMVECYEVKKNINKYEIDSSHENSIVVNKLDIIMEFIKKKFDDKKMLLFIKNDADYSENVIKRIETVKSMLLDYNMEYFEDELDTYISNTQFTVITDPEKTVLINLLQNKNNIDVRDIGNVNMKNYYYNTIVNNFYYNIVKISTTEKLQLELLRFLENKISFFYSKHVLNSYDITNNMNKELQNKILIEWYSNKIDELNATLTESLLLDEYNLNIIKETTVTNDINDFNSIVKENIIPTSFYSDTEISYSYAYNIYKNTVNKEINIKAILDDSIKTNCLIIKSLLNVLYNTDLTLILHFKYTYDPNESGNKIGDQNLIYSVESLWTEYYNNLTSLIDHNSTTYKLTDKTANK